MSLQTRLGALITAIGADIKALSRLAEGTEAARSALTPAAFGVGLYKSEVGLWHSDGATWVLIAGKTTNSNWRSALATTFTLATKDNVLHDVTGPAGNIPAGVAGKAKLNVLLQVAGSGGPAAGTACQINIYMITTDGSHIWAQLPIYFAYDAALTTFDRACEVAVPAQAADVPVKMQYKATPTTLPGLTLVSSLAVGEETSMSFEAL